MLAFILVDSEIIEGSPNEGYVKAILFWFFLSSKA